MAESDPYIGKSLGSFQIEKCIGSGAMGVVYLAVHETTRKKVAIKILPKEMVGKGQGAERFHREANLLQQFKHPNIVRFQAFGRNLGTLYVAMELVEGGTLDEYLDKEAPLDWRKACQFAIEICDALHYAHEREVVHRDLKPSNLLLTAEGKIKLSDFGIAKDLVGTALTATGRTLGTAAYMAPEQISGTPAISHKTDLYALGVILHQMICKSLPFEVKTQTAILAAHLNTPAPRLSQKNPEIPVILDDITFSLLQKAPGDRPWDALAVATRFRELLEMDAAGKSIKYVVKPGVNPLRAGASDLNKKVQKGKPKAAKDWKKIGELAGLFTGLALLLGLIGYYVWPVSAAYYHDQAARLMASTEYSDWNQALNRYIKPLETKFPDHAFKDDVRQWKDRLYSTQADRRAEILDKSTIAALSRPDGPAETLYVKSRDQAAEAIKADDLPRVAGYWLQLSEMLKPMAEKDETVWGWQGLAQKRGDEARKEWEARVQPLIQKQKRWIQAKEHGSPTDEEETRADFEKALKQSKDWSGSTPESFPASPVFVPVMPSQPADAKVS